MALTHNLIKSEANTLRWELRSGESRWFNSRILKRLHAIAVESSLSKAEAFSINQKNRSPFPLIAQAQRKNSLISKRMPIFTELSCFREHPKAFYKTMQAYREKL